MTAEFARTFAPITATALHNGNPPSTQKKSCPIASRCKTSSHELQTWRPGPPRISSRQFTRGADPSRPEPDRRKGPAGFTIAEAARSAGVSPAAPYRHFRDREELMGDVARLASSASPRTSKRLGMAATRRRWRRCKMWAGPISPLRATSLPITPRCSRPAFRIRRVPELEQAGDRAFEVLAKAAAG